MAALALLLGVAGAASAQSTIFVDANGGDDGNNGQQPTVNAGVNGPVRTLSRALTLAGQDGAGNVISIEAGEYLANVTVQNAGSATNYNNLTFLARPDQDGNTEVEFDVNGGEFLVDANGFAFASQGGGTFSFIGNGDIDLEDGSVDFGTSIVSFDSSSLVIEQTDATVTGTVGYGAVPSVIRFNGEDDVAQSTILPPSLDIPSGALLIDIDLDGEETFTLGSAGLTLGDDGGVITLQVAEDNTIAGTITTVDGSGGDASGDVVIDGDGAIGALVVNGARTVFGLEDNGDSQAASVMVQAGTFVLPTADRYVVGGDFMQTGGSVSSADPTNTILVVEGDFRRTANVAGNFSPLNVYLEGTEAADFAPGTNLSVYSLHINATDNDPEEIKMVTFLQDITVTSTATGTNGAGNILPFIVTDDAEVDLNGNLVNVTQGGESLVDGTVSDSDNSGAVRFTAGGIASGEGIYSSVLVSGPSIDAEGEWDFTGALILLQGGIDVTGTDVSPLGESAGVIVNIAASVDTPEITGPFNADEEEYDLTYQDSEDATTGITNGTFVANAEFDTDFIRDLTVDVTNAIVDASAASNGEISGDVMILNGNLANGGAVETAELLFDGQTITVLGTTTVESNAILNLTDGAEYQVSTADNVVDGRVNTAATVNAGTLTLLNGAVIMGTQTAVTGTTAATSQSQIWATVLLDEDATAEISMVRTIAGDITEDGDGGTLTLGLVADRGAVGLGGLFTQENNGNIAGDVELEESTLILASAVELTAEEEDINIGTLDTQGNVFFLEGPDALNLYSDVIGSGAVWPASDSITINGDADADDITIPVFHPGDENDDDTIIAVNILVTEVLRITGNIDTSDFDTTDDDYAVTLEGQDGNVPTLIVDDGYSIDNDDSPTTDDDELIISGPINLTTYEEGTVNDYTDLVVLATENVQTFTVNFSTAISNPDNGDATILNSEDADYTVMAFVVNGALDLNTNQLSVMGDVTFNRSDAVFNDEVSTNEPRIIGEATPNPDYSELAFVGEMDATFTVTPNDDSGVTTLGDGVDIRIAKATPQTMVTLAGSPLVFDDDFSATGVFSINLVEQENARGGFTVLDDETLILDTGVFMAGDPSEPNDIFVRLDHTNFLFGSATSDAGQGFVFVPNNTQFPTAFIEGNVRKRIYSDPSLFDGDITPGRVVYPVGASNEDAEGEGYAQFVLDFESIDQSQSFGRRNVTVSFVDEFAGGTLGLPVTGEMGTQVDEPANFYWLVRSNPSLGSGTFFNVEARYDGYELASATADGGVATIDELTLIRRQFGDEMTNPWTLISEVYDNFLLQDPAGDEDPVVIAQGAEAFLGPQGTLFTFGLTQGNRPVANGTEIPTDFALNGNLPNPFSARTAISFDLPEAADVTLEVYDVMGRRVVSVNKGAMTAGADQRVELDGTGLASGVYVFRLNAVGASETWSRSGQITLAR